jgi:hypothetical protein
MAAARIAAVVLFFSVSALAAQSTRRGHLTIQVTDRSGAVISGGQIKVYLSPNNATLVASNADAAGQTVLDLTPGNYTLWVAARGFEHYRQDNIEINEESNLTLDVVLIVGRGGDPSVFGLRLPATPEESYVLDFSIPLRPLDSLPLRPRRIHKKHFLF